MTLYTILSSLTCNSRLQRFQCCLRLVCSFKPKLLITALKLNISQNIMFSKQSRPHQSSLSPSLSLSSSRVNRWDPHLENQPWLWHSGATVARQRERGRQAVASAGCPQQQQGGTLHLFNTSHHLFNKIRSKYIHTELCWLMKNMLLFFFLLISRFHKMSSCIIIIILDF